MHMPTKLGHGRQENSDTFVLRELGAWSAFERLQVRVRDQVFRMKSLPITCVGDSPYTGALGACCTSWVVEGPRCCSHGVIVTVTHVRK